MSTGKRILILVTALSAGLALLLAPRRQREAPPAAPSRSAGEVLREIGVLEPHVLARIHAPFDGRLVHIPTEGERVSEGDLLFRLDDSDLLAQIESERDERDARAADLDAVRAERGTIDRAHQAGREKVEAELQHAELRLAEASRGLSDPERRQWANRIRIAELDLEDNRVTLERQRELVERGFAVASSLEPPERAEAAARAFLNEQRTRLALLLEPLGEEERLALEAEQTQALAQIGRTREQQQREIAASDLRIEALETELKNRNAQVAHFEARSKLTTIHAPTAGMVRLIKKINWGSGTWNELTAGHQIWMLDALGDIVDPDDMRIECMLHEADALRVSVGTPVQVELTAFPEAACTGRVTQITAIGQDRSDITPLYRQVPPSQQAMFRATITFDAPSLNIRPGMTASVLFMDTPAPEAAP